MPNLLESAEEFINVEALKAYIKALEVELNVMKSLHDHLGFRTRDKKVGKLDKSALAYTTKSDQGKALEIAQLSGLKVTRVKRAARRKQK